VVPGCRRTVVEDPLAEYVELLGSVRSTYGRMDALISEVVKQELGWDVPQQFLAEFNGTTYRIQVYADAQKVTEVAPTRRLPEERKKIK